MKRAAGPAGSSREHLRCLCEPGTQSQGGHIEACARQLHGLFRFSRGDKLLAGYPDEMLEIEVCAGIG
jgi:hypothetical protein